MGGGPAGGEGGGGATAAVIDADGAGIDDGAESVEDVEKAVVADVIAGLCKDTLAPAALAASLCTAVSLSESASSIAAGVLGEVLDIGLELFD
jgi:hypothetical protein